MSPKRFLFFVSVLLILSVFLSACGGAAFTPSGWSGLTVYQDIAYLAVNQFVYAIRVSDGTEVWRYPAQADRNKSFFAAPVVTDDGQVIIGGYNRWLYSLSREDGTEKWSFEAKDHFIASPLVAGGMIFAPNSDGTLYALDFQGKLVWSYHAGSSLWAQPVTDEQCSCIYLASMGHKLYSLDAKTGKLKPAWGPVDLGSAIVGTPTLSQDGTLYIGTFGKEMAAVSSNKGEILWRVPTDGWVWSGPALDGDRLFFGDISGGFYILSIPERKIIKKLQPDSPAMSMPLVTKDGVYFTTESGTINAIDRDGNPLWSHTIGGKIYTSPAIAGDTILVAPMQTDPILVGLSLSGSQRWAYVPPKK